MTARNLFDAIGLVDDELIEAADRPERRAPRPRARLAAPLAACLCLAAGIGMGSLLYPDFGLTAGTAPEGAVEGAAEDAKTYRLAVPDPDALAALVLPGETGGGDVYFAFEAQELALPDIYSDACVERDALLPKTLPVYRSAMVDGGVDEERMRGQLREALAALGLDESLADAAELSYGSELERGGTPNSPIGWAMAATLTLAVEPFDGAPDGLELRVTNDGWVHGQTPGHFAQALCEYATRAEAEQAAGDAAARWPGLAALAGAQPQAVAYTEGRNYDGAALSWAFAFYDAAGGETGGYPVETGDWTRVRLYLDKAGELAMFNWFDFAHSEALAECPVIPRAEAEKKLRAGEYLGSGADVSNADIVAVRLVYEVARGTAYYIPFWCFTVDAGPFEQEAAGLHEYRNCYVPAIEVEAVPELAQAAGLL